MIKKYWSPKFYRISNTGLIEGTKYLVMLVLELSFQRLTFPIPYPGDDRDSGTEPNMTDNLPSEIPYSLFLSENFFRVKVFLKSSPTAREVC